MMECWVFEKRMFEEEEVEKIRKSIEKVVSIDMSEYHEFDTEITAKYEGSDEFCEISVNAVKNQYNVKFYILTIDNFSFYEEILTCGCDYCEPDCPYYGLSDGEIQELIEKEVREWEEDSKKTIKTINSKIELRREVYEYEGRLYKGYSLLMITNDLDKVIGTILMFDELTQLIQP